MRNRMRESNGRIEESIEGSTESIGSKRESFKKKFHCLKLHFIYNSNCKKKRKRAFMGFRQCVRS